MRWLFVALLVLAGSSVRGQENPPFQHLDQKKELWKLYSRGNDDFEEFDEVNSSNFETAQIRVTMLTGHNENDSISVWILYHANLSTDNYTSIHKPSYKLVKKMEDDTETLEEATDLRVRVGPYGRPIDSSLSGEVLVLGIPFGGAEETHKGRVTAEFIPPGLLNGKVIRQVIETIDWEVTVKDRAVEKMKLTVQEADKPGKRKGAEVLKLIRSSDTPKVSEGFPTRVGKIRRVEQKIGGEGK